MSKKFDKETYDRCDGRAKDIVRHQLDLAGRFTCVPDENYTVDMLSYDTNGLVFLGHEVEVRGVDPAQYGNLELPSFHFGGILGVQSTHQLIIFIIVGGVHGVSFTR